ncbi:Imm45 family immunity protein [Corticibacterium sp. UT-5YL-CI-8]|nr:Imm45 family immunity protein [Tianweitania sp. UT-5YL-CI-8]
MPALQDIAELTLGDILRLPRNYDLGPDSDPVDLLVYDANRDGSGLGLMVASGYKSGLVFALLPLESRGTGGGIDARWLRANWDRWFTYSYHPGPIPIQGARVLGWDQRTLTEIEHAHSRPA